MQEGYGGYSNGSRRAWEPPLLMQRACFSHWLYQAFPVIRCETLPGSEAVNPFQWHELSVFAYQEKWWGIWSTLGTAVPQLLPPPLQASMWCCPIVFCNLEKRGRRMVEQARVVSAGWSRGTRAQQSSCEKGCGAYHLSEGTSWKDWHRNTFFDHAAFSYPSPWNSALVVSVISQKSAQREQQMGARTRPTRVHREQCLC